MVAGTRKDFTIAPARQSVHRRSFLKTATALAGGAFLPDMAWAAQPGIRAGTCVDLRCDSGKNQITPVKNQDDPVPCNACTAFAVVAAVEGTFNKSQANPVAGLDLDEKKLFGSSATVASGGCGTSHWWPKYALEVCKRDGVAWEGNPARVVPVTGFESLLQSSLPQTQGKIKDWLVNTGPVIAVMVQYEDFYTWGKVWSEQNPGVPNPYVYEPGADLDLCQPVATTPPPCQCRATVAPAATRPLKRAAGSPVGGHVVTIVGFDDRTSPESWICKNSWGDEWNGDGYVLIAQGSHPSKIRCYIDEIDVYGVRC